MHCDSGQFGVNVAFYGNKRQLMFQLKSRKASKMTVVEDSDMSLLFFSKMNVNLHQNTKKQSVEHNGSTSETPDILNLQRCSFGKRGKGEKSSLDDYDVREDSRRLYWKVHIRFCCK